MTDEILTIKQVADYLKVNERTIYRLAASAELPAFNLKRSVGQGEVCVCGGAGQGATTRNGWPLQGVATPPCAATSVQFTL
jgi:excisionase family DNA binding protein